MTERQICADCGCKSPETETNYTLIGAQFGWRVTRRRDADGTVHMDWRCPACWRKHLANQAPSPSPSAKGRSRPPSSKGRSVPPRRKG